MKLKMIFAAIFSAAFCCSAFAGNQEKTDQQVSLTIYSNNFAVVRQSRQVLFEQGLNTVKFTDIAEAIDPTSVNLECLSAPGAVSVLEQNYEYDLENQASLLRRCVGKNITVSLKGSGADTGREITGRLLSAQGNSLILKRQTNDIEILNDDSVENISLKDLPDDLALKPTLVWLAEAKKKGTQLCRVTYTTGRIAWHADYSALLNAEETKIDLAGWVTIDNKSGAAYKDAVIKLIAGDVRKIAEPAPRMLREKVALSAQAEMPAFEEETFMEYHLYTLGRQSTINNNQTKQIEFIKPAQGVPVKKLYIYERGRQPVYRRSQQKGKVQVKLEFENTTENNLGIVLPKGKVRVFKKNPADDALEFIGEDRIDHTAEKEKLSVYIGDAFDIVPEHTTLESKHSRRMRQQTHKVELRNRKDTPATVFVDEKFPSHVNWSIDRSTHKYKKHDARTARFEVKIKADSTATLEYTATQKW